MWVPTGADDVRSTFHEVRQALAEVFETIYLEAGDVLVLYTDGINEAMNAEDVEFGMEKVRRLTAEGGDADAVRDRIVQSVLTHVGSAPPFDDMCLVVIERVTSAKVTKQAITDTVDAMVIQQAVEQSDQLR